MKKTFLLTIIFSISILPIFAQKQDSLSIEEKIYTELTDLIYDHTCKSYITKKEYKKKYGKWFFRDVNRLSKTIQNAPKYTQEQFLKAVYLHQNSIAKNYETIQLLKRKNLKFKRWGATILGASLGGDLIATIIISKKKDVEISYTMNDKGKPSAITTRTFNKAKAYRITQYICSAGAITGIALLIRYGNNVRHYDPGFSLAKELYIQECGLGIALTKKF